MKQRQKQLTHRSPTYRYHLDEKRCYHHGGCPEEHYYMSVCSCGEFMARDQLRVVVADKAKDHRRLGTKR